MNISKKLKDKLATGSMMIALFFNPLGFDIIQRWLMSITGNLWYANFVMYFIAALFFGLSMLFRWLYSRKKVETYKELDI